MARFPLRTALASFLLAPGLLPQDPAAVDREAGFGIRAEVHPREVAPGEIAELRVVLTTADDRYVYAMKQPGEITGLPTAIELEETSWQAQGEWREPEAEEKTDEILEEKYKIHHGSVVFTRRFRVPASKERETTMLRGKLTGMACNEMGCLPPKTLEFTAEALVDPALLPPAMKPKADEGWDSRAKIHSAKLRPGDATYVSLWIQPAEGRYVYASTYPGEKVTPTKLELALPEGFDAPEPFSEPEPIAKVDEVLDFTYYVHKEPARFFTELRIADTVAPGTYTIELKVTAAACDETSCLDARTRKYELEVEVLDPR